MPEDGTPPEKDVEERKEIESKSREIQELKKKVEELKAQVSKGKTPEAPEMSKMLEDLSEILDFGFSIFGASNGKPRSVSGLLGEMAKLTEETQSFRKEVDIYGRKGMIDFNIRTGPLNSSYRPPSRPMSRETWRKTARPLIKPTEGREPLVDILDEGEGIKVIAELPGVEREDLNLELARDVLTIRADTQAKKYYREVKLPTAVEKEIIESTYRNGILEVKLKKRL